jgi:hypothetical protein
MISKPISNLKSCSTRPVWVAGFLGFVLPGAGQIFCGQDNKGVFLTGIFLLGHWLTGGISSLILCPAMMLDACLIARKLNQGLAVKRWEFFPSLKILNRLREDIIPLAIIALIVLITLARLVAYGYDYDGSN